MNTAARNAPGNRETPKGPSKPELWLIRHGETEWSATGRHTGLTDIPLTAVGEQQGERLRRRLCGHEFALVLTSPLRRARETCTITGYGAHAILDADLSEWNYGEYEGRTTADIRLDHPHWDIWTDGVPNGETLEEVSARADRAITHALAAPGNVVLFAHAHLFRVLAARWLGLKAAAASNFALSTASLSILGYEREHRVLRGWNDVSHLDAERSTREAPTERG